LCLFVPLCGQPKRWPARPSTRSADYKSAPLFPLVCGNRRVSLPTLSGRCRIVIRGASGQPEL
jgi:hypothetical protein